MLQGEFARKQVLRRRCALRDGSQKQHPGGSQGCRSMSRTLNSALWRSPSPTQEPECLQRCPKLGQSLSAGCAPGKGLGLGQVALFSTSTGLSSKLSVFHLLALPVGGGRLPSWKRKVAIWKAHCNAHCTGLAQSHSTFPQLGNGC